MATRKVSAIAAKHKDASPIRVLLRKFDIEVVEGAGANERKRDKGGARALRIATRLLKSGSTFSMTADIPPGPARKSGIGIVMVGRYSGRPIVPLAVAMAVHVVATKVSFGCQRVVGSTAKRQVLELMLASECESVEVMELEVV